MKVKATIGKDGTVTTEFEDDTCEAIPSAEALAQRLRETGVGSEVVPSMRAVRGIVARLRSQSGLSADVEQTLALIEKAANAAMGAHVAFAVGNPVQSEYTRDVLAADLVFAGKATRGKRDIHVEDGVWQVRITQALDAARSAYATAAVGDRQGMVAQVCETIFGIAGRRPTEMLVKEALEAPRPAVGRPRGTNARRKRAVGLSTPSRTLLDIYREILRDVGLEIASTEALDKARRRRK